MVVPLCDNEVTAKHKTSSFLEHHYLAEMSETKTEVPRAPTVSIAAKLGAAYASTPVAVEGIAVGVVGTVPEKAAVSSGPSQDVVPTSPVLPRSPSGIEIHVENASDAGARDFADWEERPFSLASANRRMSMLPVRPVPPSGAAPAATSGPAPQLSTAPRRSIAFPKSSSAEELQKQLNAVAAGRRESAFKGKEKLEVPPSPNSVEVPPSPTKDDSSVSQPIPVPANGAVPESLATKENASPPLASRPLGKPNPLPIPIAAPLIPAAELPASPPLSILPAVAGATPAAPRAPPTERTVKLKDDKEVVFGPDRVGDYLLGPQIGSGTFAKVRLAEHNYTHQSAVCKMITFPEPIDPRDRLHFFALREAAVMMALPPNPNIATLYEFHRTDAHVELVMSLAPGEELFGYCEKFVPGVNEHTSRLITTQLLGALDHLHTHSVLHRDIKLDNVFFEESTGKVTLIDFGLATFFHPQVRLTEILGTASYASPSLLTLLEDGYGSMSPHKGHMDLWALGVLVHGMITGRFPFEETEPSRLLREIYVKNTSPRPFPLPDTWDPEAREKAEDFLKTVLDPANEGKITAKSLLQHPWIRGADPMTAPRIPISKPTPSFVTPTRELADANNYARNFAELARLVAAKVQSRQMRLAIPFGGGNLGAAATTPGGAAGDSNSINGASISRPGSPASALSVGRGPTPTARPISRLSVLSNGTEDDYNRSSFESDGTAVSANGGSSSNPNGERKRGLKKFFGNLFH